MGLISGLGVEASYLIVGQRFVFCKQVRLSGTFYTLFWVLQIVFRCPCTPALMERC
jgi:hypothetical protein